MKSIFRRAGRSASRLWLRLLWRLAEKVATALRRRVTRYARAFGGEALDEARAGLRWDYRLLGQAPPSMSGTPLDPVALALRELYAAAIALFRPGAGPEELQKLNAIMRHHHGRLLSATAEPTAFVLPEVLSEKERDAVGRCLHPSFSALAQFSRPADDAQPTRAELTASCAVCQAPVRFLGLTGGMHPGRPTVSLDQAELRLVITLDPYPGTTRPNGN